MPNRFTLVASLLVASACVRAPTTPAADTSARESPSRPRSDGGLATWPRTDPPPFPAEQLNELVQPLGQHLDPARLRQIAAFIRWYERDPFDPTIGLHADPSTRTTLLAWLVESPEISVTVSAIYRPFMRDRGGNMEQLGSFLTVGSTFGMAADAIEHPERAPESAERQAEGIASGLRWYEAAVARGAERNGFLDELIQLRDQGGLVEWFQEHITFTE